jgi:hypothetical protein
VVPLLINPEIIAWLTPAGAEIAAHESFVQIPLIDSRIRLETHLVARANDKSHLVSEYFRAFVKRIEEDRSPIQLPLPLGGGSKGEPARFRSASEARELRRRRA